MSSGTGGSPSAAGRQRAVQTPEFVGCRLPIQQAGFDSLNLELAIAVSEAGGLGMVGAQMIDAETLVKALERFRGQTTAPVAVNFASPLFEVERDLPALEVAIELSAMVELFFYGDPDVRLVDRVHAGGCLASWQVGSVADALQAVQCGCDSVIDRDAGPSYHLWI